MHRSLLRIGILAPLAVLMALAAGPAQAGTDSGLAYGSAVTQLGKGAIQRAGLDLAYSRLTAKCATAANGTVRGATTIAGGVLKRAGAARTPRLPVNPPVGYRVPGTRPDVVVTLNKQVRDPLGGMTVSAVSVDAAPGAPGVTAPREYAVARCGPARQAPDAARTVVGYAGSEAKGVIGGLTNQAVPGSDLSGVFGGLPGLSRTIPLGSLS